MDLEKIYDLYSVMIKIRLTEEKIVKEYSNQEIRTPVHLYVGEEAIAAGVSMNLNENDYIVSNHRSHGHCLAKGMQLEPFFKELYGKEGGCTNGWGGSMHLQDIKNGIIGTSAIVAGGIPIGAGLALKQKINMEPYITVIYFGDGAVDEGVFWETINFCALKKLPVLFVMEDNEFASQTASSLRHSYDDINKIIKGFNLEEQKVDGNNVIEITEKSYEAIKKIRQGKGPYFLHCKTYRWLAHVGPVDDTFTGYRDMKAVECWKNKCPIKNVEEYIKKVDRTKGIEKMLYIKNYWEEQIDKNIKLAKEAPYALD